MLWFLRKFDGWALDPIPLSASLRSCRCRPAPERPIMAERIELPKVAEESLTTRPGKLPTTIQARSELAQSVQCRTICYGSRVSAPHRANSAR